MAVKTATGAPAPVVARTTAAPATKGFWAWLNKRLPVDEFITSQMTGYWAPKNFNIWYFFGSLALAVLALQLLSGIYLTMFYKVGEATSFDSATTRLPMPRSTASSRCMSHCCRSRCCCSSCCT